MTGRRNRSGQAGGLRKRAEDMARAEGTKNPDALSPEAARQVLHELRVHQFELEMQNEELRRAQAELDASRARYFDLYDLAPVGYVTLSEQGLILEANLTAAMLLGVARGTLIKRPFSSLMLPDDQNIYYRHRKQLFETRAPCACELRMLRKDGDPFWVRVDATTAQDVDGAPVCRAVLSDITEHRRAEVALFESARRYRTLVDAIDEGFCVIEVIFDETEKPIDYRGGQSVIRETNGTRRCARQENARACPEARGALVRDLREDRFDWPTGSL
jgi:PAS domain S-box-containing protein